MPKNFRIMVFVVGPECKKNEWRKSAEFLYRAKFGLFKIWSIFWIFTNLALLCELPSVSIFGLLKLMDFAPPPCPYPAYFVRGLMLSKLLHYVPYIVKISRRPVLSIRRRTRVPSWIRPDYLAKLPRAALEHGCLQSLAERQMWSEKICDVMVTWA